VDRALLDTDAFSEILKGVNANVIACATEYRSRFRAYTISTITIMEIVKGFHKVQREEHLQKFVDGLSAVEILTFDLKSAELAGRIYAELERTGQPIGRADPMIAAIAIQSDLTLITGNTAHYERIQKLGHGLRLGNWRA
jgi:tRNA(fMet)-specific endonuclease VapC